MVTKSRSGTKQQWDAAIDSIYHTYYEQCDDYIGMSYEQARPYIVAELNSWTVAELISYANSEL